MSAELELVGGKFLSADNLGISEAHRCALLKTLALLEAGVLDDENEHTAGFSMGVWGDCGTVCCIGGTAEAISGLDFRSLSFQPQLAALFCPPGWSSGRDTTKQAAIALRGYLETGNARASWIKARSGK